MINTMRKGKPIFKSLKVRRSLKAYLLISPFLLLFLTFIICPVVLTFFLGFTDYDLINPFKFIGFDNFRQLFFENNQFLSALKNTFLFAVVVAPIGFLACFLIAWLINKLPRFLKPFLIFCFFTPTLTGNLIVVWKSVFTDTEQGVLNYFLTTIGILENPQNWTDNPALTLLVVAVVEVWRSFGIGFLILCAAFHKIPIERYEAGAVEGIRNKLQELFFITIPSMVPELIFAGVIQVVFAFSAGDILGLSIPTLNSYVRETAFISYEIGLTSAASSVLIGTILLVSVFLLMVLKKLKGVKTQ